MATPTNQNAQGAATHGPAIPDVTGTAAAAYTAADQAILNATTAKLNLVLAALRSANIIS